LGKISNNLITGNKGEEIAARYLENHGFRILDRNWEIKMGELDIVASKNNTTYFVEVKTQFENQKTSPVDELTPSKIRALRQLVAAYSQIHPDIPQKFMLSAVCVILDLNEEASEIKWIENLID
jgi:putative endonuclease